MPIQLETGLTKGWKQKENSRFGACAVIRFKDSKTGAILFEFAPLIEDCHTLTNFAEKVLELDRLHKNVLNYYSSNWKILNQDLETNIVDTLERC